MLLYLYFFVAGCLCHITDIPKITVLHDTMATLPCPHGRGDVTWSRFINGERVTLITIKSGLDAKDDKRYSSLADNSLVIRKVKSSDTTTYLCNNKKVYLEVTTDANMVPGAGNVPVTPGNNGLGFSSGPGHTENQQPSDLWKIPVGVVVGGALVLLVISTLRFCTNNRMERDTNSHETVAEGIYAEIGGGEEQPGRESYFESPYYWTSISETQSTPTTTSNNRYSTVNKLTAQGNSSEECVYYLAENPIQTGNE